MIRFLKTTTILLLLSLILPIFSMQNIYASNEKDFEKAMKNSVVLYLNKSNVLLYGEKSYISDNRDITPYKDGEDIYLPIDFFADSIEGKVSLNKNGKATITVGKNSKTFDIKMGTGNIAYANIKDICSAFSYNLSIQDNGLLAYSEKKIRYLPYKEHFV